MKFLENPKIYKYRYGLVMIYTIAIVLFWDIIFKALTDGFDINIIPNFFMFLSSHNTGAAYGIFSGKTELLAIVSAGIVVLILLFNWFKKEKSIFYSISLGLIVGGAIGNMIDRIFLGYVRDFIKFSFFSPVFNIADSCLVIGVICFAIYVLFFDKTFKKKSKTEKPVELTKQEKNVNDDVLVVEDEMNKAFTVEHDHDEK